MTTLAVLYKNFLINKPMVFFSLILNAFVFVNFVVVNKFPIMGWLCLASIFNSLNVMTFNTYLFVEDKANKFKVIYKVMGLRRNQYFIGGVLSAMFLTVVLQLSSHLIGLCWRLYKQDGFKFAPNELSLMIVSLLYYLQQTFVSIAFSYAFKKIDTARSVSGIVFPLTLYYTAYAVLSEGQQIPKLLSPFTEIVDYAIEVGYYHRFDDIVVDITPYMIRLAIKTLIFALLAIYLENVVSYEDDHGKHPLFFLRWCLGDRFTTEETPLADQEIVQGQTHENSIQVRYLSKQFGKFTALKDVNVDLQAGKIHCLLGHNGAGKSTFINILIGIYKASSGRMTWMDQDLVRMHHEENGQLSIGVCPPENILWDKMTVRQHLKMMCLIRGVRDSKATIDRLIALFKLETYKDYSVKELSGGNKRKLTISMALVGDPSILLFDEPTSALDPEARKDVWDILQRLRDQSPDRIILLTTHHLEEAERLADNIIFLASGTVKLVGTVAQLKQDFGAGYQVEINFTDHQPPESLLRLKSAIEEAVGNGFKFTDNNYAIEDRKLELKLSVKDKENAIPVFRAIQSKVPNSAFVSIGTNTLERAYIEIDKTLHKESSFTDENLLTSILSRLYKPDSRASVLKTIILIARNKINFLIHNILELLKIVAQYLITGASVGLLVWVIKDRQIPLSMDIIRGIFYIFIYFEVGFSTYSVFNLVYDAHKDIKQVMLANKVSPRLYFIGKLAVDVLVQAVAYLAVFGLLLAILWTELKKQNVLAEFLDRLFAVAFWKVSYFCAGFLFYRFFSTPKNVLYYYALFYILLNLVVFLLSVFLGKWFGWTNDLQAILKVVAEEGRVPWWRSLAIFGTYSLVYLSATIVIENHGMLVNFRNIKGQQHRKLSGSSEERETIDLGNSTLNDFHVELRKTVANEERETMEEGTPTKLRVTNLTKRYFGKKVAAVNDVSFNVPHRVNFGLVGPNGAGKSTVFNIILSKVSKSSGNVWIDKTPNYHLFSPLCASGTPYNFSNFAICFQGDSLWEELSVRDNLDFYRQLNGVDSEALDSLLVYFEFEHYLAKTAGELSSGNKRKLCIIVSLLSNPNFLLFDEATCGIDINMRLRMRNIVQFFKERNHTAGIMTTHFLKDIEIFCDKIGIIDKGEFLCVADINLIKKTLGGYMTTLTFSRADQKESVMEDIRRVAKVKVVKEDSTQGTVKAILSGVDDVFALFFYLIDAKGKDRLADFALNQLSIEDIYLDVFNRAE